ncbi:unnamed protein product [Oppiella nova]|uniref:Argonaute n=1 Tax=Oppiella nova TaxID=334625 RepID=A0A7R9QPN8_9ACAR|nr:unnamed protein product [Oppiella nova]CAG2171047.1 unnamed protein product [Oppiella nova]
MWSKRGGPGGGRGGRGRGGPGGGGGDQRSCNYCKESGHIIANCPKLANKPDRRAPGGQPSRPGPSGYQPATTNAPTPQRTIPVTAVVTYEPTELQPKGNRKMKPTFVGRPGVGRNGRAIALIANHFRLLIKDITVYHYDIQFECNTRPMGQAASGAVGSGAGGGDRESRNKVRKLRQMENRLAFNKFMDIKRELFRTAQGVQLRPVFDGNSIVYTRGQLAQDQFTGNIEVTLDGKATQVRVNIQFAQAIDLSAINLYYDGQSDLVPREAMQALDIILRYGPTSTRVPIGNSLYPKWETHKGRDGRINIDDVGNKQVVFGHYQSTRLTKMGPTILVDRSATAFFTAGPLLEFMRRLKGGIPRNYRKPMNDYLLDNAKGLRVYTEHLGYKRRYTIKGLSQKPSNAQTFEYDDESGRKVRTTVKDYFRQNYPNVNINDTEFPCLIPQASKTIYLPMDVCYLYPDQPVSRNKLTGDNTAKMVRECGTQGPVDRFAEITNAVAAIKTASQLYLTEFQLDIDSRASKIPGRVLAKPAIKGLDRKERKKMHRPVELRHWAVANLCENGWPKVDAQAAKEFGEGLCEQAASVGMTVHKPTPIRTPGGTGAQDIEAAFREAKAECRRKGGALQMILFVIPDDNVYNVIKHVGDCNEGIVTQCVKAKNAVPPFRGPDRRGGVQSNLLLKINTKLGGVNRILEALPDKPKVLCDPKSRVMIIGADVTHPAPADKLESSVAACIGSIDADHCKYSASIRAQERSARAQAAEMIKEFDVMIKELLDEYRKALGGLPNHIIYYRDGVSESQFQQVLDYEHRMLLEACLAKGIKQPKVTFITVQKRHHTRFRPEREADGLGAKRNIPPGTTVDSHVVHPTDFDFYLCSHVGIQGTSRPTHYYVLHDDYKFTADDLQKLSYYLCYVYARCDTPISIPAPVQYAHLAAYRARNHIVANIQSGAVGGGGGGSDRGSRSPRDETDDQRVARERALARELNRVIKVDQSIKNNMYYC